MYIPSVLLLKLLDHSENKILSTTFLQHELKIKLLRSSKIQNLDFSKSIGLTSRNLSSFIKNFLQILFLIICRNSVTISL